MKYTKNQVTIDAIQYTGRNDKECLEFCPKAVDPITNNPCLMIETLEGDLTTCSVGDWIIKGVEGEFYPCKNSIFQKTYTATSDLAATNAAKLYSIAENMIAGVKWYETNSTLVGIATLHGGFEITKELWLVDGDYSEELAKAAVLIKIREEIQNHLRFTSMLSMLK